MSTSSFILQLLLLFYSINFLLASPLLLSQSDDQSYRTKTNIDRKHLKTYNNSNNSLAQHSIVANLFSSLGSFFGFRASSKSSSESSDNDSLTDSNREENKNYPSYATASTVSSKPMASKSSNRHSTYFSRRGEGEHTSESPPDESYSSSMINKNNRNYNVYSNDNDRLQNQLSHGHDHRGERYGEYVKPSPTTYIQSKRRFSSSYEGEKQLMDRQLEPQNKGDYSDRRYNHQDLHPEMERRANNYEQKDHERFHQQQEYPGQPFWEHSHSISPSTAPIQPQRYHDSRGPSLNDDRSTESGFGMGRTRGGRRERDDDNTNMNGYDYAENKQGSTILDDHQEATEKVMNEPLSKSEAQDMIRLFRRFFQTLDKSMSMSLESSYQSDSTNDKGSDNEKGDIVKNILFNAGRDSDRDKNGYDSFMNSKSSNSVRIAIPHLQGQRQSGLDMEQIQSQDEMISGLHSNLEDDATFKRAQVAAARAVNLVEEHVPSTETKDQQGQARNSDVEYNNQAMEGLPRSAPAYSARKRLLQKKAETPLAEAINHVSSTMWSYL